MALSLIVLVAAGLLIQSLIRLTTAPLGYERDELLTADIRLPASSYPKPEDSMRFWDRLGLKLDSLPGVQGVAFASSLASGRGTERRFRLHSTFPLLPTLWLRLIPPL
jgi:hypothetical protein